MESVGTANSPAAPTWVPGRAWSWGLVSSGLVVAAVVLDQVGRRRRLRDAVLFTGPSLALVIALLSALVIGSVVAARRPEHPAGWLIWALGVAFLVAATSESYAAIGLRDGTALPAVGLVAGLANAAFVAWLSLLTMILALTPSGSVAPGWPRRVLGVSLASGLVFFLARLVRPGMLDPPLHSFANPMGAPAWAAGAVLLVGHVAAVLVNLGLVTSVALLLGRYRRARGMEREQLRWVSLAAIGVVVMAPVPALAHAKLSAADANVVVSIVVGLAFTVLLLGVAAGVLCYRLYDVDRILSVGTTYLAITGLVVVVFVLATLGLSLITNSPTSSSLRVASSTLAAAAAAAGLRRRVQNAVDRHFHRRAFDADAVIRRFLAAPGTDGNGAEQVLRDATGDRSLRVGYWRADGQAGYVTANGVPITFSPLQGRGTVLINRGHLLIALIDHDLDVSPASLVASCGQLALAELDNIRLRAELRTQLAEVHQSRSRLAQAAADERHRLERNLHDGAQQRLVAVMVGLRTTVLRADRGRPVADELQSAIDALGAAVRELRELANGLVPTLLVSCAGSSLEKS